MRVAKAFILLLVTIPFCITTRFEIINLAFSLLGRIAVILAFLILALVIGTSHENESAKSNQGRSKAVR